MAHAELVKKVSYSADSFVEVTGITKSKNLSSISKYEDGIEPINIVLTASNQMLLDECERSVFDAVSAAVCLMKESKLVSGGGAIETSTALYLEEKSKSFSSSDHYVFKAFADALKLIPSTLAKNAGMNSLTAMMELEMTHKKQGSDYGISAKKGAIANMADEKVVQPSHVTKCMISLAVEFVTTVLKIDDMCASR